MRACGPEPSIDGAEPPSSCINCCGGLLVMVGEGRGWVRYLVFAVHGVSMPETSSSRSAGCAAGTVVAPILATLAVRTIACHVAGVSADATDDVCGEVPLLRTVVLSMSDLSAWFVNVRKLNWHRKGDA